jgi:hypothetical protein
MRPLRTYLLFLPAVWPGFACSRASKEMELRNLQQEVRSLTERVEASKAEIAVQKREAFLDSTSSRAMAAEMPPGATPGKSSGDSSSETVAMLQDRLSLLKQRNEQLRAELQAYRARHASK